MAPKGSKNALGNKGGGRKEEYKVEYAELAFNYALLGADDKDLGRMFDVTENTINVWKRKHPKFKLALKDGKDKADTKVAKGLFQRAIGYDCPETKPQWVQDKKGGRWEYADMIKHYPPEVKAAIHWLNNRQKKYWRERREVETTANIQINITQAQAEAIETANNRLQGQLN